MKLNTKTKKALKAILIQHISQHPTDITAINILVEVDDVETWIDLLKEGKEILCMAGDELDSLSLEKIIAYDSEDNTEFPFETADEHWKYAIPATLKDLEDYLVERV